MVTSLFSVNILSEVDGNFPNIFRDRPCYFIDNGIVRDPVVNIVSFWIWFIFYMAQNWGSLVLSGKW